MIKIVFYKHDIKLYGFRTEGHAFYAKKGKDIVCAAVSALTQNCALSLMKFSRVRVETEQKEGYLECLIKYPTSESELLLKSLRLGLLEIERLYPEYMEVR